MTPLQEAVLKAIPFSEDPIMGYVEQWVTLEGIKDYFNPRREEIILQTSDEELKKAIRFLVKQGLVKYLGNQGRQATYCRPGAADSSEPKETEKRSSSCVIFGGNG